MPSPLLPHIDNLADWNNDNRTRAIELTGELQSIQAIVNAALEKVGAIVTDCDRVQVEVQELRDALEELPHE